jgi:cysteine desulfurase
MIYLDNAATTPLAPEVLEAMRPFFEGEFGNASSVHRLGSRARVALEEARNVIAHALHAEPREIVFTSGGTEANNSAIKGVIFQKLREKKSFDEIGIITSPAEHHAVLEPIEWLSKVGASVTYAPISPTGSVLLEGLSEQLFGNTALVSFMMVNNETGAINPLSEIVSAVKNKSKALTHTDAVQAFCKMPIDVKELEVDFLSLSAHKIHGPKGIGALYIKSGTPWEPLLHGGAQERNRRGGTEPVALAVGFAEAVKIVAARVDGVDHVGQLKKYLLNKLGEIPEIVLNSAADSSSSNFIVSFSFIPEVLARLDADALIIRFDLEGIAISNGSACTSGSLQPSHVLLAMGKSKEVAMKSVRVSFSRYNTVEEIDRLVLAVEKILNSL